jgi:hypothetical protein
MLFLHTDTPGHGEKLSRRKKKEIEKLTSKAMNRNDSLIHPHKPKYHAGQLALIFCRVVLRE